MVAHIARDLGIEASVLRRWVNQEREDVLDLRPNRPIRSEAATEVERLQRELRRVTMERDILKKSARLQSLADEFFAHRQERRQQARHVRRGHAGAAHFHVVVARGGAAFFLVAMAFSS